MNNIIEGMKILEKTSIIDWNFTYFWIVLAVGVLVAVLAIAPMTTKENNRKKKIFGRICYVIGIIIMFLSIIPFPGTRIDSGRYTYECKMENNVSAKHISDNFNIISVEDDIWTIEDKER